MNAKRYSQNRGAFTLAELLFVILILGVLTTISLPVYVSTVQSTQQGTANANARALAAVVRLKASHIGTFDTRLADYTSDMGGSLPVNPCSGTNSGYTITTNSTSATITAITGTNCGPWTPASFTVRL